MQINFKQAIKPLEASLMLKNSKIKITHNPLHERIFFKLRHDEQKATIIAYHGCVASIFKLNCVDGSLLYTFLTKIRKEAEKDDLLSLSWYQVKAIIDFLKKFDEQSAQVIFNEAISHERKYFDYEQLFKNNSSKRANCLNFKPINMFIAMKVFSKMESKANEIELRERTFELRGKGELGSEITFLGLGLF